MNSYISRSYNNQETDKSMKSMMHHKKLWIAALVVAVLILAGLGVWWGVYLAGHSHKGSYKTVLNIQSNINTITQDQLASASNITTLLQMQCNVPEITNKRVFVKVGNHLQKDLVLSDDGVTKTIVQTGVDGVTMKFTLTADTGLNLDITADKNMADVSLEDLQKFPGDIVVSWYAKDDVVQIMNYTSYDMNENPTVVDNVSLQKPDDGSSTVIYDMVLTTVT